MAQLNVVGIDLGTTYSAIARLDRYGQPIAIANAEGEFSTPSVVHFSDEGPVVGTPALRSTVLDSHRTVQNAKRDLGLPNAGWTIDGKRYTPVDVSSLVLRKLKEDAQEQIGPITYAVITVPAHFDAYRRQLTIQAAEQAGITVLDLVNEPVAAALCFVLGEEGMIVQELADDQMVLVYDLGGGTFDLSLVQYDPKNVRVLATSGDLRLGGVDWNDCLMRHLIGEYKKKFGDDLNEHRRLLQDLALDVEQAKRDLSNPKRKEVNFTVHGPSGDMDRTVTVEQFEALTGELVERTRSITKRLLEHTETRWAQINTILSVGGATRMPMIRKMLRTLSGVTPNYSLSPDLSVAHGAALYAGILLSKSEGQVPETVRKRLQPIKTTNVNSHSLGLMIRDAENRRVNHVVIPRNTPLPATAYRTVGTTKPNQKRIRLQVVEGEGESEQDTETICTCVIDDLPENLPENSIVQVALSYEENGLLEVRARHLDTGLLASVSLMREKGLSGVAGLAPQPASDQPKSAEYPEDPDDQKSIELPVTPPAGEFQDLAKQLESNDPATRVAAIEQVHRRWLVELFPQIDELAKFDLEPSVRDTAKQMIDAVRQGKRPTS